MTTIDLKDIVSARDLPRRPAGLGDAIVGVPSSPGKPMFLAGVDEIPPSPAVQAQIDALRASQGSGLPGYEEFADLPTLGSGDVGRMAVVTNDPTPANNGAWRWTGTAWVKSADRESALEERTVELGQATDENSAKLGFVQAAAAGGGSGLYDGESFPVVPVIVADAEGGDSAVLLGADPVTGQLKGDFDIRNNLSRSLAMRGGFEWSGQVEDYVPALIGELPDGGLRGLLGVRPHTGELVGLFDIRQQLADALAGLGAYAYLGSGPVIPTLVDAENRCLLGFDMEEGTVVGAFAGSNVAYYTPPVWVGATTASSAVVSWVDTERSGTAFVLHVSESGNMQAPDFVFQGTSSADGVASIECADLSPSTLYHYGIAPAGSVPVKLGKFRTHPAAGAASFKFGAGSCSRSDSDLPIYQRIGETDPLFFIQLGDLHYSDITTNDKSLFLAAHRQALANQRGLFRSTAVPYLWDDHDFGPNDTGADNPAKAAAAAAYRELVPNYGLEHETAIYQSFVVGRVRFVMTDCRSERSPKSATDNTDKVVLGAEQEAWFKAELLAARDAGQAVCWITSFPWIGAANPSEDKWCAYTTERARLANWIASNGLAGRIFTVSGDVHMLAAYDPDESTDGDYSTGGGANMLSFNCAPIDNWTRTWNTFTTPAYPGIAGDPYGPRRQQFGMFEVEDDGTTVDLTFTGYSMEPDGSISPVMTLSKTIEV